MSSSKLKANEVIIVDRQHMWREIARRKAMNREDKEEIERLTAKLQWSRIWNTVMVGAAITFAALYFTG